MRNIDKKIITKEPSKEVLMELARFFLKTTIPRILADSEKKSS